MPYTPIPDQTVNGPWGSGPYPPWFEEIAQRQGMGGGPQKAAAFKNYVAKHPDWDFGQFWNQFRPGGALANHQFYIPQPGQPPPQDPPAGGGNQPNPVDPTRYHVQTERPQTQGSDKPGHWQRLVSFRNGVRQERWEWREDPTPATPPPTTTPPAPTPQQPPLGTDPPQTETKPPATDPPYVGKPKPNPGGWQGTTTPPINPNPNQTQGVPTNNAGGNQSTTNNMSQGSTGSSLVAGALGGIRPTISPNTQKPWKTRQVPQNPNPQYPLANQ